MTMEPSTKTTTAGIEVEPVPASSANSNMSTENANEPASNAPNTTSSPSSYNPPSQSHLSTAQKVFSGRPNAGLMCNNLRANPFSVSGNSSQSSGILAKPKFSLKPSSFSAIGDTNVSSTTIADQPSVPSLNPFLRPAKLSYDIDHETGDAKEASKETTSVSENDKSASVKPATSDKANETSISDTDTATDGSIGGAAKSSSSDNMSNNSKSQQPLLAASTEGFTFGSSIASRAAQSSFVFGEALDSRVTNVTKENGTNGLSDTEEKPKALTLAEAATEYKKQQESGPILPVVETLTGEEGESNVLQINCKLFLFNDKDQTWVEKGRGLLRLNDCNGEAHSRIVMRTVGIHRVIMNTSIWHSMICERANQKSIRITGTQSDQVHVYLITGSPADIDHLYNAVSYRIQRLKQQASTNTSNNVAEGNNSTAAKRKTDSTEDKETSPKKLKATEDSTSTTVAK